MTISSIHILNFRNLSDVQLTCSPTLNVFFGMNAAGKTSLLETLYFLTTGKSFRTHQPDTIVQHNHDAFSISINFEEAGLQTPIGIRREVNGSRQIRINRQTISSIAPITQLLPMQFIGTSSQSLLLDGPKIRRQFLDWGLFHTNPSFYDAWKTFQKLLTQRNAALKARTPKNEIQTWSLAFADAAEALNHYRKQYLAGFLPHFLETASALLNNYTIEFRYLSGWPDHLPLSQQLSESFYQEQQAGFSLFGPQRAELQLFSNNHPVQDILSQGQQKLLSYTLRLAQGVHLHKTMNKPPIYLIDDLPSELDHEKRELVFNLLSEIQAQVFVTAIDADQLSSSKITGQTQLFHVKHGMIHTINGLVVER